MHTTRIVIVACLVAGMAGCSVSRRDPSTYSVRERQQVQRGNVAAGVDEGDLTRREARQLRNRSNEIREARRNAKRDDGRLDRKERRKLQKKQQKLGNDIYEQRHDADTR